MTLLNELECRAAFYLKRASESDAQANAAIDPGERRAWMRIAATWRGLAVQASCATALLRRDEPTCAQGPEPLGDLDRPVAFSREAEL